VPLHLIPSHMTDQHLKASGTFPEQRHARAKQQVWLYRWVSQVLGSHLGWRSRWTPRCSCSSGRGWRGPGDTPSTTCIDTAGFQAWLGASPAPGAAVLTPSRHQACSAGPQHRMGLRRDVPAACSTARTGLGKGQGDPEVLEEGLINPIAPKEGEIQEDDLSLVDCLRLSGDHQILPLPFCPEVTSFPSHSQKCKVVHSQ